MDRLKDPNKKSQFETKFASYGKTFWAFANALLETVHSHAIITELHHEPRANDCVYEPLYHKYEAWCQSQTPPLIPVLGWPGGSLSRPLVEQRVSRLQTFWTMIQYAEWACPPPVDFYYKVFAQNQFYFFAWFSRKMGKPVSFPPGCEPISKPSSPETFVAHLSNVDVKYRKTLTIEQFATWLYRALSEEDLWLVPQKKSNFKPAQVESDENESSARAQPQAASLPPQIKTDKHESSARAQPQAANLPPQIKRESSARAQPQAANLPPQVKRESSARAQPQAANLPPQVQKQPQAVNTTTRPTLIGKGRNFPTAPYPTVNSYADLLLIEVSWASRQFKTNKDYLEWLDSEIEAVTKARDQQIYMWQLLAEHQGPEHVIDPRNLEIVERYNREIEDFERQKMELHQTAEADNKKKDIKTATKAK